MSTLRKDFESWVSSEGHSAERWGVENRQYKNRFVHGQWLAYQAATERAAKVAEAHGKSVLDGQVEWVAEGFAAAIRGTGSSA